jgi:hypothetical protein
MQRDVQVKRVSVVGTVHKEKGLASASALLAILEQIRPEVLFLEAPSDASGDYLDATGKDLESAAVSRYLEIHHVDLVPVDLPIPDAELFQFLDNNEYLFKNIERRSPEYCRLLDEYSEEVRAHGFAYLNSERCSTNWSKVREAALAAIEELAYPSLTALYELWIGTNERREKHMMKSIDDYCRKTTFSNGVFLVGAGHRQSLIDKSREQRGADSSTVEWDFPGFLEAGGQ